MVAFDQCTAFARTDYLPGQCGDVAVAGRYSEDFMNDKHNASKSDVWSSLSPTEKKLELFRRQKDLLDTFLATGAISQAQHDKSLNCLHNSVSFILCTINGNHFFIFQNSIFRLNPRVPCEYLNIKDL